MTWVKAEEELDWHLGCCLWSVFMVVVVQGQNIESNHAVNYVEPAAANRISCKMSLNQVRMSLELNVFNSVFSVLSTPKTTDMEEKQQGLWLLVYYSQMANS